MALDLTALFSGLTLPGLGGGKRLVLTVGEEAVVLTLTAGRRVLDAWVAAPDPRDGRDDIADALNRHRRLPVAVLVDTFEQMFREEKVPKVNLMDQAKVVDRHLRMAFPGNNLQGAVPSGTDPAGNRYFLFASVPPTPQLQGWLAELESLGRKARSVHALPLESVDMLLTLAPAASVRGVRWRMLFTFNLAGGLRQVVTKQHRIMLARLTPPPPPDSPIDPVAIIDRDFQQTLAYIKRMGYEKGDHLDLVILAEEPVKSQIQALDWEAHTTTVLSPAEAGGPLRLSNVGRDGQPYADVLHAAWFATKRRPALTLRWSQAPRLDARAALIAAAPPAALAAAAGVLVMVGLQAGELADLRDTLDGQTHQRNAAANQLARESARLKELPYTPEEVRPVIALADELDATAVHPQALFAALGQGLAASGAIIDRLDLSTPDPLPRDPRARTQRARGKPTVEPIYVLDFAVVLPPTVSDDASALAIADALELSLAEAFPDAAVRIVEPPVTVAGDQTLSAEMTLVPVPATQQAQGLGPGGQPLPAFLAQRPDQRQTYRVTYQITREGQS